jgi:tetratricopeptide (TPR) repeat protein
LARAGELYEQARASISAYAIEQAMTLLDEATDALGDQHSERAEELRLRMAVSRTWSTFSHDAEAALAELDRIADHAASQGLDVVVPLAFIQKSVLLFRLGEQPRALAALRGVAPYERLLSTDDRVRMLINRGTIASMLLQTEPASADLALAADVARNAGLDRFAYMALHNRGYVEFLRGDLPAALRLMDEADRMEAPVDKGIAHLDRGRVLIEAGLVTDAWEALQTAQSSMTEAGLEAEADEVELDLARCEVLLGRGGDAAVRVAPLIERYAARGARFREIEARVLRLEAHTFSSPDNLTAEAEALAGDATSTDPKLAEVAGALYAESLVRTGRAAEASVESVRALSHSTQLARRCLARRVAVDLALATGDVTGARRALRAVVDDLRAARRGVSSLDLKTGMALHASPLAVTDVALAARSGSPSTVLASTERWRTASGAMPQVRPSDDPPEQALWTRLRKLRADLRDAEPGADLSGIRRGLEQTVHALRRTSWARDLGRTADDLPASPAEIRVALADRHTAMASMTITGDALVSVVGQPGGRLRLVTVPGAAAILDLARQASADLEALARVSSSMQGSSLRAGIARSLTDTLDALNRALGPALPGGKDPLLLVPPVQLAALPWAMLSAIRGRSLTVSLAATHWLRHSVVVTDPVVRAVAGPDLRTAPTEQAAVGAAWGQPSGAWSTGQDFRTALASTDLVHVAAHGRHEPDNPLFSSLLLADGPTFVHEIEGLKLQARHVVLSACRAGRVNVRPGDEPLGLTACLLAFGVSTVVAPVSVIGDDLAVATMTAYHEGLASGLDAATALAAATTDAPLLAASFTCFGAPWRRATLGG